MSLYSRAYKRRPTGLPLSFGSSLEGWYDFKDLTTLFQNSNGTTAVTTDYNPVGYWGDKSGKGRHLIQATSADQPRYYSGDSKGIFFSGYKSLKCINGATWAGNLNTFTIFIVYTPPTQLGSYSSNPTIFSFDNASHPYAINLTCDGLLQVTNTSSFSIQYNYYTSKTIPNNYLGMYYDVKQLHTIVKTSSTTQIGLKDRTEMTDLGSFASATSYTDLIFGYNSLNQMASTFEGYIKEVIFYSRNLSSIEYLNIIDYLIAKYSIDVNYTYPSTAPVCPTTTTTTAAPTTTTAAPTTTTASPTTTTAAPSETYYCVCDTTTGLAGACGSYTSNPNSNPNLVVNGPYSTLEACNATNCSSQYCASND